MWLTPSQNVAEEPQHSTSPTSPFPLPHIPQLQVTMTLATSQDSPSAIAASLNANGAKPNYLIVYASPDASGRSWCGDCRKAEAFVEAKFGGDGLDARVVYAGLRDELVGALFYCLLPFGIGKVRLMGV